MSLTNESYYRNRDARGKTHTPNQASQNPDFYFLNFYFCCENIFFCCEIWNLAFYSLNLTFYSLNFYFCCENIFFCCEIWNLTLNPRQPLTRIATIF